MNQEQRERRIYLYVASTLMVGLIGYGLVLLGIQNYNQKRRTDLPLTNTLLLAAVAPADHERTRSI